ncbi:MAG: class I SAM-dependent methyltransferase [Candidatus Sumerlaeota bacterium]|nr:class I SAM-dependent methyltransferase [Candidatus Sumerlaeota bacterium]
MKQDNAIEEARYLQSCGSEFWQKVFRVELDYLARHLAGCVDILSVGCGPAIIEVGLAVKGFRVVGLDVSREALACAPDTIRKIIGRAEDMNFRESAFDAAIYVASMQFIEDYRKAIENTAHVLRPTGRIIVMLLNPQSIFFKEKAANPESYVRNIKHTNLKEIESAIAEHFHIQTEYFMGIRDGCIIESREPGEAILYIIGGQWKNSSVAGR